MIGSCSESVVKIAGALLRAQRKIGAAAKDSKNPFFKSKYADLGSVMEACKDALNSEGISVLQPVASNESGDYVVTTLLHESGEYLSAQMRILPVKNMQEFGSAITYARRYGLQSLAFICAEDDDGEGLMQRKKAAEPVQPKALSEGKYRVPGGKHKGEALQDFTPDNLYKLMHEVESYAVSSGKGITPEWQEFLTRASAFLELEFK